jgi:hypothetical protein
MTVRPAIRRAGAAAVAIVAAGIGYLHWYEGPMRVLEHGLVAQLQANSALRNELEGRTRITEELRAIGATTLGSSPSEVANRFRGALRQVANACGLTNQEMNSHEPGAITNPGGAAKLSFPSGLKTKLRDQRDFAVVSGTFEGRGSLEQVLRALGTLEAQPWIHRIDSFTIKPEGAERAVFSLKAGVSTLYMPDLAPKSATDLQVAAVESAHVAAIVQKSMMREPPAVAHPAPAPDPGPSAAPAPAYADWKLTGVTVSPLLGLQAMMTNLKSGEKVTLGSGSAVADARLVSGNGGTAVFEIGGQRFEVNNGQTLEQRRPARQ